MLLSSSASCDVVVAVVVSLHLTARAESDDEMLRWNKVQTRVGDDDQEMVITSSVCCRQVK